MLKNVFLYALGVGGAKAPNCKIEDYVWITETGYISWLALVICVYISLFTVTLVVSVNIYGYSKVVNNGLYFLIRTSVSYWILFIDILVPDWFLWFFIDS